MNVLVNTIKEHTLVMFHNAETAIRTCDLNYVLFNAPIWKHAYHMLHSCDQWFINPEQYVHPDFHEDGLNNIDENPGDYTLSREALLEYLRGIEKKTIGYLESLTDAMLYENPEGCKYNRLSLALGAVRHLYSHLGNINGTTILEQGKWPRVVGMYWRRGEGDDLWE